MALSLALVQAPVLENQAKPFYKKNTRDFPRNQGRQTNGPPTGVLGPPPTEDTRPKWEDKLAALRSQRRAQGLCMKCGEKWNKQHKCPNKIALHVLEEFLDVMQADSVHGDTSEESSEEVEVFSPFSFAAMGVQGRKTIKLTGLVQNQEILILIDSGSSCTFISDKAVDALKLSVTTVPAVSVTCGQWGEDFK